MNSVLQRGLRWDRMEGEHAGGLVDPQMHDAYQAYQAHAGYLDPAQAQAMATYMPDFAAMDPASQAAAMQHYAQQMPSQVGDQDGQVQAQPAVHQSETESDLEDGVDAGELAGAWPFGAQAIWAWACTPSPTPLTPASPAHPCSPTPPHHRLRRRPGDQGRRGLGRGGGARADAAG